MNKEEHETPNENFVAVDVKSLEENKPENPLKQSKNLELVPLKSSKENNNNSLSPEVHNANPPTQGSTMWKKKPGTTAEVRQTGAVSNATVAVTKPNRLLRVFRNIQIHLVKFLDHYTVVGFMTLITLYALLGDDTRVLATNKNGDQYFFGMACCCLALFGLEMILSCIAKEGYIFGFFFWLDLISTASLIFDIQWITDILFGTGGGQNAQSATSLARASRASRIATRTGRIVRIVRLIRLVKLYKHAQQVLSDKKNLQIRDQDEDNERPNTTVVERRESKLHTGGNFNLLEKQLSKKKAENTIIVGGDSGEIKNKPESLGDKMKRQITANEGNNKPPEGTYVSKSKELAEKSSSRLPNSNNQGNSGNEIKDAIINNIPQETNVGKKLSDLTTRRVIMLVMSIMLSIPIFSLDTYIEEYTSYESGLRSIYMWYHTNSSSAAYNICLNTYISENSPANQRNPLILVKINENTIYSSPITDELTLRNEEKNYYTYQDNTDTVIAIYDGRADNNMDAGLGIGRTVFVCIVLTAGALYFSKDAHDLVLHPIENMLEKVKRIAKNPLEAAQMEENEALAIEEVTKKNTGQGKKDKKKEEATYETTILEKTIIKIGALLALGFGEAGSEIIAQNMSKSGEVDPMIPGKKIMAIFGFCDIRNFTDATEILQEDVMVFVNEIAEIVHSLVDHFSGAANKNIGDAFLLVWKFPENEIKPDPNNPSILMLADSRPVKQIADMSVISFLKIVAGINISKKLKKYKEHKGLNERMPNYTVRMGFGLHVGWAIEGAIGSEFKIDASYLSPNVNMASRLEAATKQFGVPLLISGALFKTLTEETKKEMRHIDRVTVKGSIEPMDLYTCDVDLQNLQLKVKTSQLDKYSSTKLTKTEKKKLKVYNRLRRNELKKKVIENKTTIANLFSTDKEMKAMRETFPKEFYETFEQGLDKYFKGEWPESREILEKSYNMLPSMKDGPSNTLLEVIKEHGGKAPPNWMGYRELTEK